MGNTRVDYRERQRLTVADLRHEQAYRLGLLGQHGIAHHRPGIVRGLRLARSPADVCTLSPGVAVDGFGREIVVPRELDVDLPPSQAAARYVLLHYCEDPQQWPPGRACADDPAPRVLQRALVTVALRFDGPDAADESYARARAAGTDGLSPWPLLIVVDRDGKPRSFDHALTTYTGLRASIVRSPVDGSSLQIGSTGLTDFHHFLVSTRGDGAVPAKRLGIDRDGDLHVWGTLVISGRTAVATLALGHHLAFQIKAPIPAGRITGLRLEGAFDAELRKISNVSVMAGTAPMFGMSRLFSAPAAELRRTSAALAFGIGRPGSVELLDTRTREIAPFSAGRKLLKAGAAGSGQRSTFSLIAAPLDATLEVDRVVSFKPAAEPAVDPLAREARAVVVSAPEDNVQAAELRISGGAHDDTDTVTRVSLGARDKVTGDYVTGLRMDGARRLTIPDRTGAGTRALLVGKKAIYLPPIGPKDPLLPDLMMLAYLNGLWRAGNVTTVVTVTLTTPAVNTFNAVRFAYDLRVMSPVAFVIKRSFELVSSQRGRGDLSFRPLVIANPGTNPAPALQPQTIDDFRRAEHDVHVVVVMLVEIGGRARLVVSNALLFSY